MSATLRPDEMVEVALARSATDACVVLVTVASQANLRWASNTLTTNGQTRSRSMTVVAMHGTPPQASAGGLTRAVTDVDDIAALVADAETLARQSPPEQSAQLLPAGPAAPDFTEPPVLGGIEVFGEVSAALGDVLAEARADGMQTYGYAEHTLDTTYLGTSTGVRQRHVQPSGHLTVTAKTADLSASTWTGLASRDFTDVDMHGVDAHLRRRLEWSKRRVDLAPGRYPTILPPTSVADLAIYAYWEMAALHAHEGRSVYSAPGGRTRVGQQVVDPRVTLRSDPAYPGLECAPVVMAAASSPVASVFDNGLTAPASRWIDHGRLDALVQTRYSASLTDMPVTPAVDNLVLEVEGGTGTVDDLVAGLDDGLLLTSLWYIREVDPQTLLLTGLTRDGVFVVSAGEVVGLAPNFRFNESPIDVLGRVRSASGAAPTFSREWGEWFSRTSMPALAVDDFHFSTASDAL